MYEWAYTVAVLAGIVTVVTVLVRWGLSGWGTTPDGEKGPAWRYTAPGDVPPERTAGLGWLRVLVWPLVAIGVVMALLSVGLMLFGIGGMIVRQIMG